MRFNVMTRQLRVNQYPLKAHLNSFLCFPLPVYPPILLSLWQPIIVPPLCRELICRNSRTAYCDHLVNTPIILSASAPHPTVEMTASAWQFNLVITDEGYHASTRICQPVLTYFYVPRERERDAAGARPSIHPFELQQCLVSSSSRPLLGGEMLPLVYVTLSVLLQHRHTYKHTLFSLVCLWGKLFLLCHSTVFTT